MGNDDQKVILTFDFSFTVQIYVSVESREEKENHKS